MAPSARQFAGPPLGDFTMEDIVIVAAARTAVGKFGGTLAKTPAVDLGAAAAFVSEHGEQG